jgi:hypothetical protein
MEKAYSFRFYPTPEQESLLPTVKNERKKAVNPRDENDNFADFHR